MDPVTAKIEIDHEIIIEEKEEVEGLLTIEADQVQQCLIPIPNISKYRKLIGFLFIIY